MSYLDTVKLVPTECFASDVEVEDYVERCAQEASQGWGARAVDMIILRLAGDLRIASSGAEVADGYARLLKGKQLENGRLKKQVTTLTALLDEATKAALTACEQRDDQRAELDRLTGELEAATLAE